MPARWLKHPLFLSRSLQLTRITFQEQKVAATHNQRPKMAEKTPPGGASAPGEGIRSMRSSTLFRVTNFELYAKPNKVVMALGLIGLTISVGYMAYMRNQHEALGIYTAVDAEGQQTLHKRQSRWL